MAVYKRKSWVEKRDAVKTHHVEQLQRSFSDIVPGERMLVPTPRIVDDYIRQIPQGVQSTIQQMRKDLAAAYHADKTCPITAGIFVRIAAEAAFEEWQAGKTLSSICPFWRIISLKSPTAQKLSFGTDWLAEQRKKELLTD
jgi:hypothetical protein